MTRGFFNQFYYRLVKNSNNTILNFWKFCAWTRWLIKFFFMAGHSDRSLNTLGDLKFGLVCVTNFGESSNFLDLACLAKPRNLKFFGLKSCPNLRSLSVVLILLIILNGNFLVGFIVAGIRCDWICFINGVCIVDGYIKSLRLSKSPAMIRKSCHVHELQWYFKHILSQFK